MGLFALCLRFLEWRVAALAATGALAFNLLVLPRVGGARLNRRADTARGYPIGILLYPAVVLALIVLFRHHLELAAVGWAYLAFGDGCATLAGGTWGRRRLPWNPDKSWAGFAAFVVAGGAAAAGLYAFVLGHGPSAGEAILLFGGALVGASVESLPSELDDNLLPPLLGAGFVAALLPALEAFPRLYSQAFLGRAALGAALNLAVAAAALPLRLVRPSGAWAGFLFGSIVFAFGGWKGYALLWIFFGVGTLATRFGGKRKEALGKAEEAGGRRGAPHVFANVTVSAFALVVAAGVPAVGSAWTLAATAAFATALMDTVGTEVGQAIASPTVLLPDFRRVPPGTDGAVSVAGTLAGLGAATLLSGAALAMALVGPGGAAAAVLAALLGTVLESLLGRSGAPWRVSSGHVLNFYNTLAGALVGLLLARPGGLR